MIIPVPERSEIAGTLPAFRQQAREINNPIPSLLDAVSNVSGNIGAEIVKQKREEQQLQAKHQSEADAVRVGDALSQIKLAAMKNQYGEGGWGSITGKAALDSRLSDQVLKSHNELLAEQDKQLATPEQRAMLKEEAGRFFASDYEQSLKHEQKQYLAVRADMAQTSIDTESTAIALNYANPKAVGESVRTMLDDGEAFTAFTGKPIHDKVSKAITGGILSALSANDYTSAESILSAHKTNMMPDDLITANKLITQKRNEAISFGAAQTAVADAVIDRPTLSTPISLIKKAMRTVESGNNQTAVSPAGAIGIMQVMPATAPEAAKLAGVDYDEHLYKTDAAYNGKLGDAYMDKQIKDFDGDINKALAAYNAGAKTVKNAVMARGGDWLAGMPRETQDYVKRVTKTATTLKPASLAQVVDDAVSRLPAGTDADTVEKTRTHAKQQYELALKSNKEQADNAKAEAIKWMLENTRGVNDAPSNILAELSPDDLPSLITFGDRLTKKKDVETDKVLYHALQTDPELLANSNILALRDKLSDADFKHFTGLQKQDPTVTRSGNAILNNTLVQMGIAPTPKSKDDAQKLGMVWSKFNDRVAEEERNGKRLGSADYQKIATDLFDDVEVQGRFWGTNTKAKALFDPSTDVLAIPDSDRLEIIRSLKSRSNMAVTEAQIQSEYARRMGIR